MKFCNFLLNLLTRKKRGGEFEIRSVGTMADSRYFPNTMPDFVEEEEESSYSERTTSKDTSLLRILRMPYARAADNFLQAASSLKEKILKKTWVKSHATVNDFSLYTGELGTAYLCFKAYEVSGHQDDLSVCAKIVEGCSRAAKGMREYVTFICGQAGVYAIGAVAAKCNGDQQLQEDYLSLFKQISKRLETYDVPYELLYGRAGFLWAVAFLNKYIGDETIPANVTVPIVEHILRVGKEQSHGECPLMYEWHGKKYWGAAHGLAGIMHVLMHFPLEERAKEDVKGTLRYMMKNRFPSRNYPSSEGSSSDRLVHWCHGAPGVALTLCKAAEVFPEDTDFREAAIDAGEVVWKRGLLSRVGICHGISGNAYVFLALYRLTGNAVYLYRAKAFAAFLLDQAFSHIQSGKMHGGDHPYSLFEGLAGTAYMWFDMVKPLEARFPAYEL
eukprot:TRINITY_DN35506_c0_g1_i1.p1 TRINITY_DN35506_c0_g1~~TRINITY_DN35506_c0_g1_i1.p1  ORF type:complete len:444 (+),score=78.98 TRINITY_DN35506_c0_g1_i1:175-1506(+)